MCLSKLDCHFPLTAYLSLQISEFDHKQFLTYDIQAKLCDLLNENIIGKFVESHEIQLIITI